MAACLVCDGQVASGVSIQIQLNPLWFILAGAGVVLIAFMSVGSQTLKAALINPAKTLKYE